MSKVCTYRCCIFHVLLSIALIYSVAKNSKLWPISCNGINGTASCLYPVKWMTILPLPRMCTTTFIPLQEMPTSLQWMPPTVHVLNVLQIDQLGVIGGVSGGDCARRIAKKIINRPVDGSMNFCGNGAKMGLNHTTVLKVIKCTAYFWLIATFSC